MRFLLWTKLTKTVEPAWREWNVLKVLKENRRDGFTHDAHLREEPSTAKRGVRLSQDAHDKGLWVGIQEKGVPVHAPLPPPTRQGKTPKPRAKAPASVPAANDRVSKRPRKQIAPFRVGDNTDGLAHLAQRS